MLLVSDVVEVLEPLRHAFQYIDLIVVPKPPRPSKLTRQLRMVVFNEKSFRVREMALSSLHRAFLLLQRAFWPSWTYWTLCKWPGLPDEPLDADYNKMRLDAVLGNIRIYRSAEFLRYECCVPSKFIYIMVQAFSPHQICVFSDVFLKVVFTATLKTHDKTYTATVREAMRKHFIRVANNEKYRECAEMRKRVGIYRGWLAKARGENYVTFSL